MIGALKEYGKTVLKPSWSWIGKHWKGYALFSVCLGVIPYVWFYWSDICDYFKSKFSNKTRNES